MANLGKAGKVVIDLVADGKSIPSALSKVSNSLKRVAKIAAATGVVIAGAMGLGAKKVFELYAIQEKAEAKLASSLKASGEAAGFSADQLKEYAKELQSVTTFADEAIIDVETLLSTFTAIKGDKFKEATESVLDLATMMGTDAKTGAIQLGKALGNPIKGVSALTDVGVEFTDQQRELITSLQETGRVAEAQSVILEALGSQGFAGAARAQAKTVGGAWKQVGNMMGGIYEQIGGRLAPAFGSLATYIKELIPVISQALTPALDAAIETFRGMGKWLGKISDWLLNKIMPGAKGWSEVIREWIVLIGNFGNIATIVVSQVAKTFLEFIDFVAGGITRLVGHVLELLKFIPGIGDEIAKAGKKLQEWEVAPHLREGLHLVIQEAEQKIAAGLAESLAVPVKKAATAIVPDLAYEMPTEMPTLGGSGTNELKQAVVSKGGPSVAFESGLAMHTRMTKAAIERGREDPTTAAVNKVAKVEEKSQVVLVGVRQELNNIVERLDRQRNEEALI